MDEAVDSPRTTALGVAVGVVLVIAVRGSLFFLFCLPTAAVLTAAAAVQTVLLARTPAAVRYLTARRLPPARVLWLVPLTAFVAQVSCLLGTVVLPFELGRPDFWAEHLSLPTRVVARLAIDLFLIVVASTLAVFVAGARTVLSGGAASPDFDGIRRPARDLMTTLTLVGLVVAGSSLAAYWQISLPDNLLFTRALVALNLAGSPRRALELFGELVDGHPSSRLHDTALLRAGRVLQEELGDDEGAATLFRRLVHDHPASPWADDAAFRLAQAALRRPGHGDEGAASLERFVAAFPHSCYADDALYELVIRHLAEGRHDRATACRTRLETTYPAGRMLRPDLAPYPFWILSTPAAAREACERMP